MKLANDREALAFDNFLKASDSDPDFSTPEAIAAEREWHKEISHRRYLETAKLRRVARRWNVYYPSITETEEFERSPNGGAAAFKPAVESQIRREILTKRLEAFAFVIGICSIIQTIFTVLSYFHR